MQRVWGRIRRLTPRALVVAMTTVALAMALIAVSQADPEPRPALSVAMLSGGDSQMLTAADPGLPAAESVPAAEAVSPAPVSQPAKALPTTTTAGATDRGATVATVAAVDAVDARPRCPRAPPPAAPAGPGVTLPPAARRRTPVPRPARLRGKWG